jgi:hypothetical protein
VTFTCRKFSIERSTEIGSRPTAHFFFSCTATTSYVSALNQSPIRGAWLSRIG